LAPARSRFTGPMVQNPRDCTVIRARSPNRTASTPGCSRRCRRAPGPRDLAARPAWATPSIGSAPTGSSRPRHPSPSQAPSDRPAGTGRAGTPGQLGHYSPTRPLLARTSGDPGPAGPTSRLPTARSRPLCGEHSPAGTPGAVRQPRPSMHVGRGGFESPLRPSPGRWWSLLRFVRPPAPRGCTPGEFGRPRVRLGTRALGYAPRARPRLMVLRAPSASATLQAFNSRLGPAG
jgi:hypothetical protein